VQHIYSGKVRDLYADGDDVMLVASDRVSIYDVVLPTPIPDHGKILTQLSLWWFGRLTDIVPNHVISASDLPPEWAGRAIRCRRLEMIPVECIARGYLAGLGLASYQKSGSISGVPLPPGLTEGTKLPEPIFAPTTKAAAGHDEPLTYVQTVSLVGEEMAAGLERITLDHLSAGCRAGRRTWRAHRGHEAGVRPGGGWIAHAGRRGTDPGFVAVLARRFVGAGSTAAFSGQAISARLVGDARLGSDPARAANPRGDRGGHAGPLRGRLRAAHRGALEKGDGAGRPTRLVTRDDDDPRGE
jgi:hypothetical protein